MRSRIEILHDMHDRVGWHENTPLLEVLLDIRDLLQNPPTAYGRMIEAKKRSVEREDVAEIREAPPEKDELFDQAVEIVRTANRASTTLLQKKLLIGYVKSVLLIDQLEAHGIISPKDGAKPRKVL